MYKCRICKWKWSRRF